MIVRRVAQCVSCGSKIVTRTQIGHKDRQEHSFPCPVCGVSISYALDLDQSKGNWKCCEPKNAKWVGSEEGAIKTVTLSDEIPVPTGIPDLISPFIATWGRYEDYDLYRKDETLRQLFVRREFEYAERCRAHFERGNWELFDKESPSHRSGAVTVRSRLISLYNFYTAAFSKFTLTSKGGHDRIFQRLAYAKACSPDLVNEFATQYLNSGRIVTLWKEIFSVRQSFINCYNYLQPLLHVGYWREEHKNLADVTLSDKRFNELRQLYIDCFETLCRLLALGMGFEAIIHHRQLEIPTKKGAMSLDEFAQLTNAGKRDHIAKYPIEDIFLPVIDTDFRNGIGHHSAHYEHDADCIALYDTKDAGTVSRVVGYTEFCDKVLRLFAAFELAAIYHHKLHIMLDGRFV